MKNEQFYRRFSAMTFIKVLVKHDSSGPDHSRGSMSEVAVAISSYE